jgi:RHS repeat-associated protein
VKYNFNAGANTQDGSVSYAYDAAGNRTTVTEGTSATNYSANNLNEYDTVGADHPLYDPNGNLTVQAAGNYNYDAQNRLVSASSAQSTILFAYDARNRCVSRTEGGITTLFYYEGWNLIEERNAADQLIARYVHGPNTDELVARVTASGPTYFHADALGSIVALTDARGQILERYSYDIYGAPTIKDPANTTIAASAFGNRFLFAGREYLAKIALYDYRNRFYSPATGRFLQTDPIKFAGRDFNLYRYAHNNPTRWRDPSGRQFGLEPSPPPFDPDDPFPHEPLFPGPSPTVPPFDPNDPFPIEPLFPEPNPTPTPPPPPPGPPPYEPPEVTWSGSWDCELIEGTCCDYQCSLSECFRGDCPDPLDDVHGEPDAEGNCTQSFLLGTNSLGHERGG